MKIKKLEPPHLSCDLCKLKFADQGALEKHQRTEANRFQQSNKFLKMPLLPKCLSGDALRAIGWLMTRKKIWSCPPMPKQRAHKINPDETYQCLFCKKHFGCATGFKSHFVMTFTRSERCLDRDELKALYFEPNAAGVWRVTPATQYLPSQIARLPTVRQEMAALDAFERTQKELGGEITTDAPFNMQLDPNDNPPGASYLHEEEEAPAKATVKEPSAAKKLITELANDLITAACNV